MEDSARVKAKFCSLILLALILRIYAIYHTLVITPDGAMYIKMAKNFERGYFSEGINALFLTIYPFFIALFHRFIPDWELAGQVVSTFFGSLAIVPFYLLGKSLFDKKVALISSLIFAIHPFLVRYSAEVIKEPTYWFFYLTALYFGWKGIKEKKFCTMALASIFAGISAITRTEGAALFFILGLWIFLHRERPLDYETNMSQRDTKGKENLIPPHPPLEKGGIRGDFTPLIKGGKGEFSGEVKKRLLSFAILLLTFPLLISPFFFYLKAETGTWNFLRTTEILRQSGLKSWGEDKNKPTAGYSWEKGVIPEEILRTHDPLKVQFYKISQRNRHIIFLAEFIRVFFWGIYWPLIILFPFCWKKRNDYDRKSHLFLLTIAITFSLLFYRYMSTYFYLSPRHLTNVLFPFMYWMGMGFLEMREKINCQLSIVNRRLPIAWVLVVLLILTMLPVSLKKRREDKIYLKEAGLWLKTQGIPEPLVLCPVDLLRLSFYAGGDYLLFNPPLDTQILISLARAKKVDYLVLEDNEWTKENIRELENSMKKIPSPFKQKALVFFKY